MEQNETTENFENNGEQKQLTKAERKAKRRNEKEEQKKQKRKKQKIKKAAKWAIAAAVILIIGGLVSPYLDKENGNGEQNQGETDKNNETLAVKETDWVEGNKKAKVVLIEYSDFQCPACAGFSQAIMQLREKYGDRVAFVFRHFPLTQLHPETKKIAAAAEAAGKQGKFWEMHDMLFARGNEIKNTDNLKELLKQYAWKLDLDMAKFESDLESKEVKDKINSQYREAIDMGLNATPTFFINGEQIKSLRSYGQLEDAIEDALDESF